MIQDYQPLSCDLYDYIEIACLHRYQLHIELAGGGRLDARAMTTLTTRDKEEFLIVQNEGGQERLRLDQITAITPLTEGASFGRVLLGNQIC
ncbi:Rho-binding antiterminator [compost metagenome]